jgi:hypothetical protein
VAGTWWMILDKSQARVTYRTTSCLEAFRVAARRAGGPVRLLRDEQFGYTVVGHHLQLTVVAVARPSLDGTRARIAVRRSDRVAIPVGGPPGAELVSLPGGGSFMWIPVDGS